MPAGAPKIRPADKGAASRTFTTAPSHSTPKLDAKADAPPNRTPIIICFFIYVHFLKGVYNSSK